MTPAEFWDLTWYDWGLYLFRVEKEHEEKRHEEEVRLVPWRELYALISNINRDPKKKPTPFKGSDFIKLSFDEVEEEVTSKRGVIDDDYLRRIKERYSKN